MRCFPRWQRRLILLLALLPTRLTAQASAYVPLDHPLLPLLEHLIVRGDVEDPSPAVRPFRQSDALLVLGRADTVGRPGLAAQVRLLAGAFDTLPRDAGWRVAARAGGQGYSSPRRDLTRPTGSGAVKPYAEIGLSARFGEAIAVSRPILEPRLADDPEWTGRRNLKVTGRMAEAYVAGQWRWVQVFYGQMERNWGPAGVDGIPLSGASYGRPEIGLVLGSGTVRLTALASDLRSTTDSLGTIYQRYFFAHRIDARLSRRLHLGLWETVVVAGEGRTFDGRFRNPVSLLLLANQYGLGDRENNLMIGLDWDWWAARGLLVSGQLAIDDLQYQHRSGPTRYPDRYAFTLGVSGALGRAASWRALYTQVSSLAFRTFDPAQDFLDGGVGIGRTYDDYDQAVLRVGLPLRQRWIISPEVMLIRQGEGRIQAPVPPGNTTAAGDTPELFIGVRERSYRAGVSVSGSEGPLGLSASAGYLHRVNADNVDGRTRNRFVGQLTVTLGVTRGGTLR
ncbi:MAG TPA: hypothetical protein VG692_18125 [Gemmatimonadales bacterium]|nr:hypothetical protein [Gemmatimonadales bacterium]